MNHSALRTLPDGEGWGGAFFLELQCYGSHAVETSHWDVSHGRVALTLVVPIVVDVARSCIVTVEDIVEVGTEHNLLQAKHTLREVECVRSVHVSLRVAGQ